MMKTKNSSIRFVSSLSVIVALLAQSSASAQTGRGATHSVERTTGSSAPTMPASLQALIGNFAVNPSSATNGQLSLFTDGQFSQLMDFMNGTIYDLTASLNTLGEGVLAQYSRTNDVLEKLVDPKKMFILSAATAAGAVIGGGVAKIGLDLAVKGIKELYSRISGEHHKKWVREHAQEFTQAREAYEKLENSSVDLEKNFEMIGKMLELSSGLGFKSADVAKIKAQIAPELELTHQGYLNAARDLGVAIDQNDTAKQEDLSQKAAKLHKTELSLQSIVTMLGQINQFCSNAEEAFQKADEIQGTLQDIRATMLSNENAWLENDSDHFFKTVVKEFDGVTSKHHLRVLERLGRKHVNRSEKTSLNNIDYLLKDKVRENCRNLVATYHLTSKEQYQDSDSVCNKSIFSAHTNSEIAFFFVDPGSDFEEAFEQADLMGQVAQVSKMEADDKAVVDQNESAIDTYVTTSKQTNTGMVAQVSVEDIKFNAMLKFLTHLKTQQVRGFSQNYFDNQAKIRSYCTAGFLN